MTVFTIDLLNGSAVVPINTRLDDHGRPKIMISKLSGDRALMVISGIDRDQDVRLARFELYDLFHDSWIMMTHEA